MPETEEVVQESQDEEQESSIFDDDTPLACGIEDPELCESCQ